MADTGTAKEDRDISLWQGRIRSADAAHQASAGAYERLGWAYISKARRTLDAGYYKLAEKTADVMDARFGATNESLLLRGSVDHNLHRFAEAEQAARQLVARRGIAFDYALLSDALMEQGKLTESVEACQHMMALKPGVDAYSRAANLRWLTGDLQGAIVAMEAAVRAGSPLDATNSAWTLARLSAYYLQDGRSHDALRVAVAAEQLVPDYPPALLAQGRALLAMGEPGQALGPITTAERLNPLPEYQWWLADTLRARGDVAGAAAVEAELAARGEAADPRTYSLYLSTRHAGPRPPPSASPPPSSRTGATSSRRTRSPGRSRPGATTRRRRHRHPSGARRPDEGCAALPPRRRDRAQPRACRVGPAPISGRRSATARR